MPRRMQRGTGGTVFHVMNRATRRTQLFASTGDYEAFERVLREAGTRVDMRLLAYTLMPNHWHLVVWPAGDLDLSRYMQWLTRTHAQRWQLAHQTVGTGAVYQARYRAVAVQNDSHFLTACRYVERNASRAGLVIRATEWRWTSAWVGDAPGRPALSAWPVPRPADWEARLNTSDYSAGIQGLRTCITRGVPFGTPAWTQELADRLALSGRIRGRGRPPRSTGCGKK